MQRSTKIDWLSVKAIVFDLGNVLLDLDNETYSKGWPMDISPNPKDDFIQWVQEENLWYNYETGKISTETFLKKLSDKLKRPQDSIIDYWNSILLDFTPDRFTLLRRLTKKYELYILSNTNETHIDWVKRRLISLDESFDTYFNDIFYSFELDAVKPEPDIYRKAQQRIGIPAKHLLFIDDKLENIEAAIKLGWQAIHLPPEQEVLELFTDL